ncbi:MAG: phosphoribosylanthranilate isomerase [Phycisphaerae bacterium]|nr:phosphoribosylanthranilate isomerase [Gemmatimonadaceae bacterium]
MLIKICGLTRQSDANLAESLGAHYLGAILAGGPRHLTPDQAMQVLGPRRHTVLRVAVFGTQSRTEIAQIAEQLALDVVQLHGDQSAEDIEWLLSRTGREVWPVVRVAGTELPPETVERAQAARAVLLDAKVVGQLGGTGVALDWQGLQGELAALRERVPGVRVVLAGGLNATNLLTARGLLNPDVVDVSSGVELAPGIKNPVALEAFMNAARTTANHD